MEFYIRQGATSPILKLKFVSDSRADNSDFNETLENCNVLFDMTDVKTNAPILLNEPCEIVTSKTKLNQPSDEYFIVYQFTEDGTSIKGRFEGKITVKFLDSNRLVTSKLIVPIREKLYINII